MKRYIALLRKINISGKNKIAMIDLIDAFLEIGYKDVKTHLNSGNVIFSCEEIDETSIGTTIHDMISEKFKLNISVFVIRQEKLSELLTLAPSWWGNEDREIYDNLIFVMPESKATLIAEKIGEPTEELEQILICQNSIFWSFDRAKYAKANWWKMTAAPGIGEYLTIRTANTLKKIVEM